MIQYRTLFADEICQDLFQNFIRRQVVNRCWRKEGGKWVIREDPFVDDWGAEEYQFLVSCLKIRCRPADISAERSGTER